MAKETIQIFENGEYKTYERDFAKQPLNLGDWYNAMLLDGATANYSKKATNDEALTKKDVTTLADANIKFIVNYFKNQFNVEQAKNGIKPVVMASDLNRWYTQSSGVMDSSVDDGTEAKK